MSVKQFAAIAAALAELRARVAALEAKAATGDVAVKKPSPQARMKAVSRAVDVLATIR
jgi:hypothetical protein